jgi:hypothetical protein
MNTSPTNVVNTAEGVFFLGLAAIVLVVLYQGYKGVTSTAASIGTSVDSLLNVLSNPMSLLTGGTSAPAPKVMTDLANVNENGALTTAILQGDPLAWTSAPLGTTASGQNTAIAQQLTAAGIPNAPIAVDATADFTTQLNSAVSGANGP